EAAGMVRALRTSALLERGRADVGALVDVIVRVAALADAHPAIAELDCNPVIVSRDGALAIDARVRVAPPAARPPVPALNGAARVGPARTPRRAARLRAAPTLRATPRRAAAGSANCASKGVRGHFRGPRMIGFSRVREGVAAFSSP